MTILPALLKIFMRVAYIVAWLLIGYLQVSSCAVGDNDWRAYRYIETHKQLAIDEMFKMGVPVSIKLAQGMIETDFGDSRLCNDGKNHFGIKCKDYWVGDTILVDDDAPQECFRRYNSVKESFIDHSMFLRYHPKQNYIKLFDLNPRDYFSWAYGLKEGGYATNARYAETIIELIERYQLYKFDDYVLSQLKNDKVVSARTIPYKVPPIYASNTPTTRTAAIAPTPAPATKVFKPTPNSQSNNTTTTRVSLEKKNDDPEIRKFIAYPTQSNSPDALKTNPASNIDNSVLIIDELNINKTHALIANKNLSVFYISYLYKIPIKKIYRYNDLEMGMELKAGLPIFLEPKQNEAAENIQTYIAQAGETLYDIAQRYGVKLKKMRRKNPQLAEAWAKGGEIIKLR